MGPVVDIHCHVFNGDDIPLKGFAERVILKNLGIGGLADDLLDAVIQGGAPGFDEENPTLDEMLAASDTDFMMSAFALEDPEESLDSEVEDILAKLAADKPDVLAEAAASMEEEFPEPVPLDAVAAAGIGDVATAPFRLIKWLRLYAKHRYQIASVLINTFNDEVDLFTPMLVDLKHGLNDDSDTSPAEQMEMLAKISRLSMLGRLPKGGKAHLHPFLGFDPRRQVDVERRGSGETPLELVERAVRSNGFVGVKLYPPMGFRPLGNRPEPGMDAADVDAINDALEAFYQLCVDLDIPVTAHANNSNHSSSTFEGFGSAADWRVVLTNFPDLHVNLGHFGGADKKVPDESWPMEMADLAGDFDHVYADVGNHRIYDEDLLEIYLDRLDQVFAAHPVMRERLMYGSDWFMLALHPKAKKFLRDYRDAYSRRFPGLVDRFMGENALEFLFGGMANQNARRVAARYDPASFGSPPDWLPTAP